VHSDSEVLGKLVKEKRLEKSLSLQKLAEQIGIGTRHIFSIEHEGGNPSYKVLRELIYTLELPPDDIFYPQNAETNTELISLFKLIRRCDEYQLSIVRATAEALLKNEPKKES
jgi:transcriptional regulator with XRE-family HTH domain